MKKLVIQFAFPKGEVFTTEMDIPDNATDEQVIDAADVILASNLTTEINIGATMSQTGKTIKLTGGSIIRHKTS